MTVAVHDHIVSLFPDLNLNGRSSFIRRIWLVRQLNVEHHALTAFLNIGSRDLHRRRVDGVRDVRCRALTGLHGFIVPAGHSGHRGRDAAAVLIGVFPIGVRHRQRTATISIHGHIVDRLANLHLDGRSPFIRRIGLVRKLDVEHHALTAFQHIGSRDAHRRRVVVVLDHDFDKRFISHKMLKVACALALRHIRNLVAYSLLALHVCFVFAGRHWS